MSSPAIEYVRGELIGMKVSIETKTKLRVAGLKILRELFPEAEMFMLGEFAANFLMRGEHKHSRLFRKAVYHEIAA